MLACGWQVPSASAQTADTAQAPNPGRQLPSIPPDLLPTPIPTPSPIPNIQPIPERQEPPSLQPIEPAPPSPLPPPEQLLEPSPSIPRSPEPIPGKVPETITIEKFQFEGNTAISDEDLANATKEFIGHPISFAELFQARSKVTQLYIDRGYITSGALIPPQTLQGGIVQFR